MRSDWPRSAFCFVLSLFWGDDWVSNWHWPLSSLLMPSLLQAKRSDARFKKSYLVHCFVLSLVCCGSGSWFLGYGDRTLTHLSLALGVRIIPIANGACDKLSCTIVDFGELQVVLCCGWLGSSGPVSSSDTSWPALNKMRAGFLYGISAVYRIDHCYRYTCLHVVAI